MDRKDRLPEKAKELGISLTDQQIGQFHTYYELMVEWNKTVNLTTITDYDEVVTKHFIDSLSIVKAVPFSRVYKIMDVGTGAGFPGVPIKIAHPSSTVTLLDARKKRISFLDTVIRDLCLEGISAVHARAEDYAIQKLNRESYDLCVSRAVADLAVLCEYCLPFVQVGGLFVAYKSGDVKEELDRAADALTLLGGEVKDVVSFTLPDSDIHRTLVVISKITDTDSKYPRKAGQPAKKPL